MVGLDASLKFLFENANGDPVPPYAPTLGLKSIVSLALNPSFRCGISLPNLSWVYEATV